MPETEPEPTECATTDLIKRVDRLEKELASAKGEPAEKEVEVPTSSSVRVDAPA